MTQPTTNGDAYHREPIVKIRDIRKTYVMGHGPSGGLFGRRKGNQAQVIVHALRGRLGRLLRGRVRRHHGRVRARARARCSTCSAASTARPAASTSSAATTWPGSRDDELSEVRSRYIGFIFQSYNLIAQYTVTENIQLPLTYQGSGEISDEQQRRTEELAGLVGLGDRLDHRPMQLSGGQQQRVAIARSLVNDPYIILADEATGNLDTQTSHEIMAMLGRLNDAGKTIIMVTHEDDIAEHAKRIIRMRDGVIYRRRARASA